MTISNRANKALKLMKENGYYFIKSVQVNSFTNRKESVHKLVNPNGGYVRGFSFKTFCELEDANLLTFKESNGVYGYYAGE